MPGDPKGAVIMVSKPLLSTRNVILKGYRAFNDAKWDDLRELLCEDVVWHPMHHDDDDIVGRENVIAELQRLRATNEAEFFGTAIHDDEAITVDFTHSLDDHGSHACADRIHFHDGCISEVWHCVTHHNGGNPPSD